jgi:hypothetical protein
MSYHVPQEIVDLIIDHLRDEHATLKTCGTVSKAWVERTRKYTFVQIIFRPSRHLNHWRRTFPDPTHSPAHNTRALSICHPTLINPIGTKTLRTFCGVVRLHVYINQTVSLAPLHGFSPAIRSLHLTLALLENSEVFNLICSFPLLEDLTLVSQGCRSQRNESWRSPLVSPRLARSLELHLTEGIQSATRLLLDLPNGLHFTRIAVPWFSNQDVESTMDLVSRCSNTLTSLEITNHLPRAFFPIVALGWNLTFA